MSLKLFSKRIWVRRGIIIAFSVITLFVTGFAFGSLRFEFDRLTVFGVLSLGCIITTIFMFYIADKIVEKNLKLINQKLSEKNTSNIE